MIVDLDDTYIDSCCQDFQLDYEKGNKSCKSNLFDYQPKKKMSKFDNHGKIDYFQTTSQLKLQCIKLQSSLVVMEEKLLKEETKVKEKELEYQMKIEALKMQHINELQTFNELNSELNKKEKKIEELQLYIENLKLEVMDLRSNNSQRNSDYKKYINLEDNFEKLKLKRHKENKENEESINKLSIQINDLERNLAFQTDLAEKFTSKSKKLESDLHDSQYQLNTAKRCVENLERELSLNAEQRILDCSVREKLEKYDKMQMENKKLQEDVEYLNAVQENNMLLKEKEKMLISLEEKNLAQRNQINDLSKELLEYKYIKKNSLQSEKNAADSILSKLREENESLLGKIGLLQANLHSSEKEYSLNKYQLEEAKLDYDKLKAKYQAAEDELKKIKARYSTVLKQLEIYKEMTNSFENSQSSITSNTSSGGFHITRTFGSLGLQQQHQQLIQQLKKKLNENQTQLKNSEEAYSTLYKENESLKENNNLFRDQMFELKKRIENMTFENEKLQDELKLSESLNNNSRKQQSTIENKLDQAMADNQYLRHLLEKDELKGKINPTKTKIVSLLDNPSQKAKENILKENSKLKEEVLNLKSKLKTLIEKGGIQDGNITAGTNRVLSEFDDIEELKKQIVTLTVSKEKIKSYFEEMHNNVQTFIFYVLGYRLEVINESRYTIMSIYAESKEDYIIFEKSRSNSFDLFETEYTNSLSNDVKSHLRFVGVNSLPSFTAALTMELFSKQTIMLQNFKGLL